MALNLSFIGLGATGGMELRAPMAIAVIGGLTVSTLLTLFVVPAVYAMFEDIKSLLGFGRKPTAASALPLPNVELPTTPSPAGASPVAPLAAPPAGPFEHRA
jgi:hypothetical protein